MWRKFRYDETRSLYSSSYITKMMERNGVWVRHEMYTNFSQENLKDMEYLQDLSIVGCQWSSHNMSVQAQRGGRGTAPTHQQPQQQTAGGGVVSSPPARSFTSGERTGSHCGEGCVGLEAGLNVKKEVAPTGIQSPYSPPTSNLLYPIRCPAAQIGILVLY